MIVPAHRPLLVAERFGPTLQGEGPSIGRQASFIRLSRCNLSCEWCDTPYTWDWTRFDPRAEATAYDFEDLTSWADATGVELVVITGGEPLLQQERLIPLVERLLENDHRVEIETNGTIAPSPRLQLDKVSFNVSPKLSHAAVPKRKRINSAALAEFARLTNVNYKFVAREVSDLDEIDDIVAAHDIGPVWVMPEGVTSDVVVSVMRDLADHVIARGWFLSPRLHTIIWGDERGR